MTSVPLKSSAFEKKSKDTDSANRPATFQIFTGIALLSKYLRNNYFKRSDLNLNNASNVCTNTYRAYRHAHYQNQLHNKSSNGTSSVSSINVSDRSSLNPILKRSPHEQRITSDEVPPNMTQSHIVTETRTDSKRKASGNELNLTVRSNSISPLANTNNRTERTLVTNISTPDTPALSHIEVRGESFLRNNIVTRNCYLCCFCCCFCSCFNKNPKPDDSMRTPISNEPQSKPDIFSNDEGFTFEEAHRWSQNFDLLMQSSAGRKVFQDFLKLEFSEENMMFYKAVEDLQAELNSEIVPEKARNIYEDYISTLSPKEVSLDSRVRELINNDMTEPTSHTFDEAQMQIYTLMQRDSYPRFVNSRLYKDLLHQLGGTSTASNSQTLINNC